MGRARLGPGKGPLNALESPINTPMPPVEVSPMIIEKIVEVPVQVIKEVIKEVPVYVDRIVHKEVTVPNEVIRIVREEVKVPVEVVKTMEVIKQVEVKVPVEVVKLVFKNPVWARWAVMTAILEAFIVLFLLSK
jgi:hypothetical protein